MRDQDIEKMILWADGKLSPEEASKVESEFLLDEELVKESRQQKYVSALLDDLFRPAAVKPQISEEAYFRGILNKLDGQINSRPVNIQKRNFWLNLNRSIKVGSVAVAAIVIALIYFHAPVQMENASSVAMITEIETGDGVTTTTLESDSICIEWINTTYISDGR